ncbi:MAG: tyrosine recombinase XerC [Clostridiales bacterium]|nr:tyrosine recombinase XerC [Clostridiales bacterium]
MQTLVNYDELPQIVLEFVGYKQTVQGRSKLTADEYALDIRTFLRYMSAKREELDIKNMTDEEFAAIDVSELGLDFIGSITPDEVYDFLYYTLNERGNQWSARARKLSALKSFYKYLTISKKYIDNDPTKNIEGPQKKTSLPKFLTLEESEALLDAVQNDNESRTRERDMCILTLFLNCGMRLSELCGINLSDVDRHFESLRVVGKGSKERLIYLNDACREALKSYINVRAADEQIKDKNALFLSSRHTRISNKTVQWMVYKYLNLAGLGNKSFSTHKLRHTAATLMYQTGNVDVRVLKDILGHEQLNTTQIYTHISDENMRRAIDNNPLAKPRRHSQADKTEDDDYSDSDDD